MSTKRPNVTFGGSSSSGGGSGGGGGGSAGGMATVEPLMRTEAQQQQINQVRLEAEMYQARLLARVEQRNQDFANFVGSRMQGMEQRQPHVTYNVYTGGGQPPPPPPPPAATAMESNEQLQALERKLQEERQQSQLRLHEATASAQQTVNQKMLEMQGEVKRAQGMARSAAAASTDDIRRNRGTQAWSDTLTEELHNAKKQVTNLQEEKRVLLGAADD